MTVPQPEHDQSRPSAPAAGVRVPRPPAQYGFPVFATYGQRVGAFLIDVGIPAGVLFVVLIASLATRDLAVVMGVAVSVVVLLTAFVVWNSGYRQGRSGQSIGKRMLGVRLVGAGSGQPIGFGRAVCRQIAHLLDLLPLLLGYFWPLWDEQRQTFADKVCATLVVQADV